MFDKLYLYVQHRKTAAITLRFGLRCTGARNRSRSSRSKNIDTLNWASGVRPPARTACYTNTNTKHDFPVDVVASELTPNI